MKKPYIYIVKSSEFPVPSVKPLGDNLGRNHAVIYTKAGVVPATGGALKKTRDKAIGFTCCINQNPQIPIIYQPPANGAHVLKWASKNSPHPFLQRLVGIPVLLNRLMPLPYVVLQN